MTERLVDELDEIPSYLSDLKNLEPDHTSDIKADLRNASPSVLSSEFIGLLDSIPLPYAHLLLHRHILTGQLAQHGLHPPLIYSRALTYESLGYADLAAADAFVVYTLCQSVRSDEWISDLEPVELNGEPWPANDDKKNLDMLCRSLVVLCRALNDLGATEDAAEKLEELVSAYEETQGVGGDRQALAQRIQDQILARNSVSGQAHRPWSCHSLPKSKFGLSRREIYPWNTFEPDRNSAQSLNEINSLLSHVANGIEARVTVLPALNTDGTRKDDVWHQLGLFAKETLLPGQEILREDSLLTAIRPLDDALCDACGADLESVDRQSMRQCPGDDCDTTFCSANCATKAATQHHKPNCHPVDINGPKDETDDDDEQDTDSQSDYPPPHAPFCGNSALNEIGRAATTTTAEWDLYFLLLTRTIQMSTTQSTQPLSLPTIKHLWGDFNPAPEPSTALRPQGDHKHSLPWSLHHNLTLPLQFFETLMHSLPVLQPYSPVWLERFDWWVQTTLYAKFRGVANATQSTFDGKPEIAAVHPVWCLANHSCEPNVRWTPTGTRVFVVREAGEMVGVGRGEGWSGIKAGEEIWSHYTDVRLGVGERRKRLTEVLGGVCRCARCLREAVEGST